MTGFDNKVTFGGGTQLRVNASKFESSFLLPPVEQLCSHQSVRGKCREMDSGWGEFFCLCSGYRRYLASARP